MNPHRPRIDLPEPSGSIYVRPGTIVRASTVAGISNLPAFRCPECGSGLIRIRRRPIDRLMSAFVPVSRFRCSNMQCSYEGNLHR